MLSWILKAGRYGWAGAGRAQLPWAGAEAKAREEALVGIPTGDPWRPPASQISNCRPCRLPLGEHTFKILIKGRVSNFPPMLQKGKLRPRGEVHLPRNTELFHGDAKTHPQGNLTFEGND